MTQGSRFVSIALLAVAGAVAVGCVSHGGGVVQNLADDLEVVPPQPDRSRSQQPELTTPPEGSLPPSSGPSLLAANQIVARINGYPIYDREVFLLAGRFRLPPKVFRQFLDRVIDREVIYQHAVGRLRQLNPQALRKINDAASEEFDKYIDKIKSKSKINDVQWRESLRRGGLTVGMLRKKVEHEFVNGEFIRSRIIDHIKAISRSDIYAYYVDHKEEFRTEDRVKWQDVFIAVGPKHPTLKDARRFAESLIASYDSGVDFEEFIRYDDGDSKSRDGFGLGERRGEISPPQLEEKLFSMREGEVGQPFELSTGIHIYRVAEREFAGQIPFNEKTQKTIRAKLSSRIANREIKSIVRELRNRAVIEILDIGGE